MTEASTTSSQTDKPAAQAADAGAQKSAADTIYGKDAPASDAAGSDPQKAPDKAQGDEQKAEGDAKTGTDAQGADEGKQDKEGDKPKEGEAAVEGIDPGKFTMQEGFTADPELLGELGAIAKDLGIAKQADAQKLVDLGAKFAKKIEAKQVEAVKQQQKDWAKEAVNDKEFGGASLDRNLGIAARARDAYVTPALRQLLGEYDPVKNPKGTGLGNHPELLRLFIKIGSTISEDKIVTSGADPDANAGKTPAQVLYPNQGKQ